MKSLKCWMLTMAVLLSLAVFPLMSTAQDKEPVNADEAVSALAEQVIDADKTEAVTVIGVINKDKDQLILNADNESYRLDSKVDETVIGQKVIVTGVVADDNGVKTFKPQSIEVAE
ncbi:MAG: hypothetical protein CSA29_03655 [Desulfobacterales bacterium]|nr:MAG: hypothetical protein CSA29_03655 [Desulfobacterales bacterium]